MVPFPVPHTKFSKINEMHEKGDRDGGFLAWKNTTTHRKGTVVCGRMRKANREPQIRDLLSESLRSQTFGLLTDSGL